MVSLGVKLWFLVSIPVVIWDLTYVLFRPRSMPGGDLYWIWSLYVIYGKHDGRYLDVTNDWVIAQSVGNAIEIAVTLLAFLLFSGKRLSLALFSSALMTFWKTILYFLVEICSGLKYTHQSSPSSFIMLFVFPSLIWLLGPLYVMASTASSLVRDGPVTGAKGKPKTS